VEVVDVPATITAVGAVVTAVGVILLGYWAYRGKVKASDAADKAADAAVSAEAAKDAAKSAEGKLIEIDGKIYTLTKTVDGKLTKLLDLTREAALAKGNLAGRAELAAEQATEAADHGGRRNGDPEPKP
jgi:hemin uptake protein HemP